MRYVIALLVMGMGCKPAPATLPADGDGDGVPAEMDCDDNNPSIYPGASEVCDGVDQDCDGEIDEDLLLTFFRDADADGFGNPNDSVFECGRPVGFLEDGTDCDDGDASTNPGIVNEMCDDVDHNCDGDPRAGAIGGDLYWPDTDGDGFGNSSGEIRICQPEPGYVAVELVHPEAFDDCDDTDSLINPGVAEVCATPYDDDCDGQINEAPTADGQEYPVDFDGDGRGGMVVAFSCFAGAAVDTDGDGLPDGVTVEIDQGGDCDDENVAIAPDLPELCDGLDNDCNVLTDEADTAIDRLAWWRDEDEDQTGDPAQEILACDRPAGYVSSTIDPDCNDSDPAIFPGTAELCDAIDNNCDGLVDDSSAIDAVSYYMDGDGDGFGNLLGTAQPSCQPIPGLVDNNFDCDDTDPLEGSAELQYPDVDGDGYGDPATPTQGCNLLAGFVRNDLDCDDVEPMINPDTAWYADTDMDMFGDSMASVAQCEQPAGFILNNTDCDDTDPHINSDVLDDACDGVDNDCDGEIDEDCVVEHCGNISTSEVWDAQRIHRITCDVTVSGPGAQLVIEDGVDVSFDPGRRLRVGVAQAGTLIVQGGAAGVNMRPSDLNNPELWGGLEFGQNASGSFIGNTTIEGAGSRGYSIRVDRTDLLLDAVDVVDTEGTGIIVLAGSLEISDSSVVGSTGRGIDMDAASTLVSMVNSQVTGNTTEPLVVRFGYVGLLDAGNAFSGNGIDEVVLRGDNVVDDTVVALLDVPYRVVGDVNVQGGSAPNLTIEAGVEMRFASGAALSVGRTAQGSIDVQGTDWADVGAVRMVGLAATPGDWDGLFIGTQANASMLSGLEILHAGGNNQGNLQIVADGTSLPEERALITIQNSRSGLSSFSGLSANAAKIHVLNSTFDNNLAYGGVFERIVFTDSVLDGNSFTNNSLSGARVNPNLVELLENNSYSNNVLPIEVRPGTLVDSAIWQPLDEDYYVTGLIEVTDNESPELTIMPGTTVYFASSGRFRVGFGAQGSLIIDGDANNRVLFSSITEYQGLPSQRGSYRGIELGSGSRISVLNGLTLRYAGSSTGAINVSGDGEIPLEIGDTIVEQSGSVGLYALGTRLNIHDSSFLDNDDEGVFLQQGSRLVDTGRRSFSNNTISGNGSHAMTLPADNLGQLESTSTFAGNNLVTNEPDRIRITGDVTTPDQTWLNLDANYWLSGNMRIGGQNNPVVTIEPGTVFEVPAQTNTIISVARLGESGGIIAIGNGDNIVFTSDNAWRGAASPGDWGGLYIGADCLQVDGGPPGAARCVLDGVTVDYAGAATEQGAVMIEERRSLPYAQPVIMQNMVVRYSGTTGIQFQARGGIVSPNPLPMIPPTQFFFEDSGDVYPAACEGDPLTGFCTNFDYCYNPGVQQHGATNTLCGNAEANVGVRNFANPFIWMPCPTDGLVGTNSCP